MEYSRILLTELWQHVKILVIKYEGGINMKLALDNGEYAEITTIRNGIVDGYLRIYNKENLLFTADIGINHNEIDMLSLEIYRLALFEQPSRTGVLNIRQVLDTMCYITPNFTYSDARMHQTEHVELGDVQYVYDNEMLTVVDRLEPTSYENVGDDTEMYLLSNSDYRTLYVQSNYYDTVLRVQHTDLMSEEINYTMQV